MDSYCGNPEPCRSHKWLGICQRGPPRLRSRHEAQERRSWRERNEEMIQRLAETMDVRPEAIEDFLYELTLQNYSSLLNPRECGWSICKVPLCYPNVCDRYMGIFDRHGNLRDPTHPKSLQGLLQLLEDFLNGASHEGCQDLPIYAEHPGGRRRHQQRFQKGLLSHEPELDAYDDYWSDTFLWNLGSPAPRRPEFKRKAPSAPPEPKPRADKVTFDETSSPRMSIEFNRYSIGQVGQEEMKKNQRKKTKRGSFGRQSVFLNDELALAHDKSHDFMEEVVNQALERRRSRSSHIGPVGNLRNERLRILIRKLIEKKGRRVDPGELRRAIEQIDFNAIDSMKKQKEIAKDISRLYSSIVQSNSPNSVSNYLLRPKTKFVTSSKRVKKVLGQQQPLQFHAPIEERRRSSKRHPADRGRYSTLSTSGPAKRYSMKKS